MKSKKLKRKGPKRQRRGKKYSRAISSKLSILSLRLHETLLLLDCYHQSWWAGLILPNWGFPELVRPKPGFFGNRHIQDQIIFCCGRLPSSLWDVQQHPCLYSLDTSSTALPLLPDPPGGTTKMSPGIAKGPEGRDQGRKGCSKSPWFESLD